MRFVRTKAVWAVVFLLAAMHGQALSAQLSKYVKKKMQEVTVNELRITPGTFFKKGIKIAITYYGKNENVDYDIREYWLGRHNYFHLELSDSELEKMCPFVVEKKKFPRLMKKISTFETGTQVWCYGKIFDNKKQSGWRRYGFYIMDMDSVESSGKDGKSKGPFDPDKYEEVTAKKLNLMRTKYMNKKVKLNLRYYGLDRNLSYELRKMLKITTESHCQLQSYSTSSGDDLGNIDVLIDKKNEGNLETLVNAKSGCVLTAYGELRVIQYSGRPAYYIKVDRINAAGKDENLPSLARPKLVKSDEKEGEPNGVSDPDKYEKVSAKKLNLMRAKYTNKKVKLDLTYHGLSRDVSSYLRQPLKITAESYCQLQSYSTSSGDDLGNIYVLIDKKNEENVEALMDAESGCVLTIYGELRVVQYSGRPVYYINVDHIRAAGEDGDLPSSDRPESVESDEKDEKSKRAFDPDKYEKVTAKKLNLMRAKYMSKKVKFDLRYHGLARDLSYELRKTLKVTTESHCQLQSYSTSSGDDLGNIDVLINKKNEGNLETLMNAKSGCVLTVYGELGVIQYSDRMAYYINVDQISAADEDGDLPSSDRPEFNLDNYKPITAKELILSRSELVNENIKLSIVYPGLALYTLSPIIMYTNVTTETHLQLAQHYSEDNSNQLKDIMIVIDQLIGNKRNVEVLSKVKKGNKVDLYGQLKKSKHPNVPEYYVDVKLVEPQ